MRGQPFFRLTRLQRNFAMIPSRLSLLAATGALALLAGCAALQPKTPEQIVAER